MSPRQLFLFGAPRLVTQGHRIALPRRKALALLAYLAATGTHHTRDSLAALLWGDSDERSAHAYLRNALWTLNKSLGADWAETEGGTVAVRADALRVDVTSFGAFAAEAMTADAPERLKLTAHAIELYTGEFMSGFTLPDAQEFTHWQMTMAESLRRTMAGLLMLRADAARASQDLFAATDAAQRWLSLDPLDERAARLMMQVLAEAGEITAATRQYHELRRRLRDELSATPEPATVAVFESLSTRATQPTPQVQPQSAAESVSEPAAALIRQTTEMMMAKDIPDAGLDETALLGRDSERAAILDLLATPDVRLVTIVAPGGMGKTLLARHIGADATAQGLFPDGVYFVALAPLCDADVVLSTIASALPYTFASGPGLEQRMHEVLADKRVLLLLDNFEHIIDGAPIVSRLLAAAPGVKAIVTSRERLNLRQERVFDLHGLGVPDLTDDPLRTRSDAAELFVRRAQQAGMGFTMTSQNAADIARICRLVEGMPLALELAASWTPLLSCAQIVSEIQTSLDFLTSPARDVPERHRSLRAVFASSWEQMQPDEQHALAHLAVFRGGFRLEAAQAVAQASPRMLLSLVNKSLLKRRDDGRFEIHELLRQFAEGMLDPEARLDAVDKHIAYYAGLMKAESTRLLSRDQRAALDVLQSEIDNIRTAWRHALARRNLDALSDMVDPLYMFCRVRWRFDDLPEMLQTAADQLPSETANERALLAKILVASAFLHGRVRHQSVIDSMAECARDLLLPLADRPDLGIWLVLAGSLRRRPGRIQPESEQFIQLGYDNLVKQGHLWGIGYALFELGILQHMQVRYAEARETLNRALYYFEKVGQPWAIAFTLDMLAENMQTLGNYEAAADYMQRQIAPFRELGLENEVQRVQLNIQWLSERGGLHPGLEQMLKSLEEMQAAGDRRGAAWGMYNIAWLHYYEGNFADAERLFLDCLRTFIALGDDEGIIWSNIFLAQLALESGRRAAMDTYIEGAQMALTGIDFPWGVSGLNYVRGDQALYDGNLPQAHEAYRSAVSVAYSAQSWLQVLRHLTGIVDIWIRQERLEDALALATFIAEHPTAWDDTRRRSTAQIAQLSETLSPDEVAAATARGHMLTMDAAVTLALA